MKRILLLSMLLALTACSTTLNFNQKYRAAGWTKVLIAPFSGKNADTAEQHFDHRLSTNAQLELVSSAEVKQLLLEQGLLEQYAKQPSDDLYTLASRVGAQGIIFSELKTQQPTGSASQWQIKQASLFVKLIDANSKQSVASSLQEDSSAFSGLDSVISSVAEKAAGEFSTYLVMLKQPVTP